MRTVYKPTNYNSVSPYLIVDGADTTIDFLVNAFDGIELRRILDDTGNVMHAEVRINDTVVMLTDGNENWSPVPSNVHVYVQDVDATYKRALIAGAHVLDHLAQPVLMKTSAVASRMLVERHGGLPQG